MWNSFDMEILRLVLKPSPTSNPDRVDIDELNELRWQIIYSYIKKSIFALSLFATIISSLIVIIRESRPWHIVLGFSSLCSLIMHLVIFLKYLPDLESFQRDIIGFISFLSSYLIILIYLFGVIYFLPKSKKILTSRSTRPCPLCGPGE